MNQPDTAPNKLWFLKHIRLFDRISPSKCRKWRRLPAWKRLEAALVPPGDPSSNVFPQKGASNPCGLKREGSHLRHLDQEKSCELDVEDAPADFGGNSMTAIRHSEKISINT
jgi:hypothetical protein